MKDLSRQILVVLTTLATIVVNILANALPINGLTTAEISNRFQVYFVPAGYVFSIWGLIYLGLLAYTIFQALPAQRANGRLRATGWWVVLANLANGVWIFLWHYERFVLTLAAMFLLLAALIVVYLRLDTGKTAASAVETWAVRLPFSVYLGWITVATIANVSAVLDYLQWNQWGISDGTWMIGILVIVVALTVTMSFRHKDVAYAAVVLWALAGIGVKFPHQGVVTAAIWQACGLIALSWIVILPARTRHYWIGGE
jgi:hypothetical protein